MNVFEIYELSLWVQRELEEARIYKMYSALQGKLQHNTQENQQKQAFDNETSSLIEALKQVPLYQLTNQQKEILDELNISPYVSNEGVEFVEDTLYRHGLDLATAAQKFQVARQSINNGIEKMKAIRVALNDFVLEQSLHEDGRYLMRITFQKDASVRNFTELKKWSADWWSIVRGVTIALDKSPEEVEIVGASNGSVVLDVLLDYGTIVVFSKIILESLKITERFLSIVKTAQEIKKNGFEIKAAQTLLESAEKEKQAAIKKIVNEVSIEINIDQRTRGDKINELEGAVEKIVDFTGKGGEIDFLPPPEEDEENEENEENSEQSAQKSIAQNERQRLRDIFKDIRLIEGEIKQIEFQVNPSNNNSQ